MLVVFPILYAKPVNENRYYETIFCMKVIFFHYRKILAPLVVERVAASATMVVRKSAHNQRFVTLIQLSRITSRHLQIRHFLERHYHRGSGKLADLLIFFETRLLSMYLSLVRFFDG